MRFHGENIVLNRIGIENIFHTSAILFLVDLENLLHPDVYHQEKNSINNMLLL